MSEISEEEFHEFICEICENNELAFSFAEKFIQLKNILDRLTKLLTRDESLQFPSLFSRIAYISRKYCLSRKIEWGLQNIRVITANILKNPDKKIIEKEYLLAEKCIYKFIECVSSKNLDNYFLKSKEDFNNYQNNIIEEPNIENYKRISVISIDKNKCIIEGTSADNETNTLKIKYNVPWVNDAFNDSIEHIWIDSQLNIIDYTIDSDGYYVPKIFILEPDYLIDASALAECFQTYGRSYLHYYRRKFDQISNSKHVLLGNLANYFLDELIYAENIDSVCFLDCFKSAFRQKPFEFTSCNDIDKNSDFKSFMSKSQNQFNNIKRVIKNDFQKNYINIDDCSLEPSFFCEKYGLQGRIDLLQIDYNSRNNLKIIELKSGSLPYPKTDASKIAINHEVQATIYRLIIESVFNITSHNDVSVSAAIMYSAADNLNENLRYAAPYQILDKEILNIRNKIIITEHNLYIDGCEASEILLKKICNIDNYGKPPQYIISQIQVFEKNINNLSKLEKDYLFQFIAFISRDLYIHKVGNNSYESYNSTSCLWNTEFIERKDSFDLISDLEIIEIDDTGRDLHILFKRNNTNDFVNFREGELCILYPHENISDTVLNNQIMKGTISSISKNQISLRFRYKQKNKKYFEIHKSWVVEHDRLDHSYTNMYKSLFEFFKSPQNKRDIILGISEPRKNRGVGIIELGNKTIQKSVIEKAIDANDYFLIVGPPGTGKTSIYAKKLIEYYYYNTNSNILLIAYTNRAVDELCDTINQALGIDNQISNKYIRIGTELSCDPKYRHQLLQSVSSRVQSRKELRYIIQSSRIIVGTLASIIGKSEIFDLKSFDIAIIDEASQILEPQIVGLLSKVEKFILIGDHKQLSTISLQDRKLSLVENSALNRIKLYDCSESFFERLYRLCEKNKWIHSYETLVYQGRMHKTISDFPNQYFYNNILLPASKWQTEPLQFKNYDSTNYLSEICAYNRLYFFDVNEQDNTLNNKVNIREADLVVDLCKTIIHLYTLNNETFDSDKTIGIITPYRNQIALIKHKLQETQIDSLQNIMIDTVERYQGSQRDIIIFSFCINKLYQLESLINLNKDANVDRKLNVALTRARKQLFLVGNKQLLSYNSLYKQLISFISPK